MSSHRDFQAGYSSIPVQNSSKRPRMGLQSLMENSADSDKATVRKAELVEQPSSSRPAHSKTVDKCNDSRQAASKRSQLLRLGKGKMCDLRDDSQKKRLFESTYTTNSRVKPEGKELRISDQVDFRATNAEKMKKKYPPRVQASARKDLLPQLKNNALIHGKKEVVSVMNNTVRVEAVSHARAVKNNKDGDEDDKKPIKERVALCLERAEQERRELSLELEHFEGIAGEFGSLVNTFQMLPPPEHKVATMPKSSSLSHSMPLSKTSVDRRGKVSASSDNAKIFTRDPNSPATTSRCPNSREKATRREVEGKLEVRGITSKKVDRSYKETQAKKMPVKYGIQSPKRGISESSKSLSQTPCKIQDISDFTSGRSLQPQVPISSNIREKVQETLRLFQDVFRKLSQENKANPLIEQDSWIKIGFKAKEYVKLKNKFVHTGKRIIGPVPGVEVGDEFRYKMELNIIGLHDSVMGGIDTVKKDGKMLATSIVCSGRYEDSLHNPNVLIYTGQGGNVMSSNKQPEDQKLERGNLALVKSMKAKNPVRVIRGIDSSKTTTKIYVYDGLYLVEKCWQEIGPHSKLVFKFRLLRIPGQPDVSSRIMKLRNQSS